MQFALRIKYLQKKAKFVVKINFVRLLQICHTSTFIDLKSYSNSGLQVSFPFNAEISLQISDELINGSNLYEPQLLIVGAAPKFRNKLQKFET